MDNRLGNIQIYRNTHTNKALLTENIRTFIQIRKQMVVIKIRYIIHTFLQPTNVRTCLLDIIIPYHILPSFSEKIYY